MKKEKINILLTVSFLLFSLSFLPILTILVDAQSNENETDYLCGPKSLLATFEKLGVEITLDELKKLSGCEENKGTTMAGLYKAVQAKGLHAAGIKVGIEELIRLEPPIIVYVWGDHFQVIDEFNGDNNHIKIIDSRQKEPIWMSEEDFTYTYSGFALVISKNEISLPDIDTKGSDIRFEEYVYNFGTLEESPVAEFKEEYIFKFKNVGNKELVIKRVRQSCSCTAVLLSEKNIPPGEGGEIKATVNMEGLRGNQNYSIYVHSNDPITPRVELQIKGYVKAKLHISPRIIHFGELKKGSTAKRKFFVFDKDNKDFKVNKIDTSSDSLSTKISENIVEDYTGSKYKQFEIEVNLAPNLPIGKLKESITVHTNDKVHPKIEIPISGTIKGNIEIYPERFFFGIVNKGESHQSKITIFTTDKKQESLVIKKVGNPVPLYLTVDSQIKDRGYEITAVLNRNAPVGEINENIVIYTSDSLQPKIEIPVYALVK